MLLVLTLLTSACDSAYEHKVISSVQSPNGMWLAIVASDSNAGPGVNSYDVEVQLQRVKDPHNTTSLLEFEPEAANSPSQRSVAVEWIDRSTLKLIVPRGTIGLQVVKVAGVDVVTVRKL